MSDRDAYCVSIRHNLVVAVEPVRVAEALLRNATNLDTSTRLARRHMEEGCIDGEYLFASLHDAKDFAVLSLDFIRLLAEKSLNGVKSNNFYSSPTWRNSCIPPRQA